MASVLILVVIAIERHVVLVYPTKLRDKRTRCNYFAILIFIWTLSTVFGIPKLFEKRVEKMKTPSLNDSFQLGKRSNGSEDSVAKLFAYSVSSRISILDCEDNYDTMFDRILYNYLTFSVLYLIPVILMIGLYTHICIVLWKSTAHFKTNQQSMVSLYVINLPT